MTALAPPSWLRWCLQTVAAVCVAFIMLITFADVFLRYWFARPIVGSSEMLSFALALMIFSAFPLVTMEETHISVSILRGKLPPVAAWIERLMVLAFSFVATGVIAAELGQHAIALARERQTTAVLNLPLAPLSFGLSFLALLAFIAIVVLLIRHVSTPPGKMVEPHGDAPAIDPI